MDCKEEVRKGYVISAEMKKVWAIQLEIVQKIFDVCKKYNLKIVSCGGTSIGALREGGYIPWDDDIDLEMLREDYDVLVKVAQKEFKDPYFFQCAYTDKRYTHGHAQVRKNGTTAILECDIFQDFHQGIFVDIFVLDAVPNTDDEIQILKDKTTHIKEELDRLSYTNFWTNGFNPRDFLRGLNNLFKKSTLDFKGKYEEYENLFRETPLSTTEEVCSMAFDWTPFQKHRRSKHLMEEITNVPFENILMPLPKGYDEILTRQYGDYMKPAKCPSLHGTFLVLDPDKPYQFYLSELRKSYIRKKINNTINKLLHRNK